MKLYKVLKDRKSIHGGKAAWKLNHKMEINKVYQGDCLEELKKIPDNSIDIIITSPPYNLGNKHHTGNKYHSAYNDDLPEEDIGIELSEEFISLINQRIGSNLSGFIHTSANADPKGAFNRIKRNKLAPSKG